MQPLISPVDHETRRSSFQRNEEPPSEDTPLINRFPTTPRERNLSTILIVGLLISLLLTGLAIGIYLLVLQYDSENILPPIEDPTFYVIPVMKNNVLMTSQHFVPYQAQNVIVVQTDTADCYSDCPTLIKTQVANLTSYNFLISSNGFVFQCLGWRKPPLYPELSPLVLAFVGNFTTKSPPLLQVESAKKLIETAVYQRYLAKTFKIIGKNTKYHPVKLFSSLSTLPEWSSSLSGGS